MPSLEEGMRYFVHDKHIMHSLSIAFGNACMAQSRYENADANTVYDLASLTKLFTLIAVMQLCEKGKLSLADKLALYDKRFIHLGNMSIAALMAFEQNIITPARLDEAPDRDAALALLFAAQPMPHTSTRMYSDIHSMVLKYVVESASGMAFFDYLTKAILTPCGMAHTYARPPVEHTQSYQGEHRIELGRYIVRQGPAVGIAHDPKAGILSDEGRDLCGHAGLFSTLSDMTLLAQALLKRQLLSDASLESIARNRTGRALETGDYTQYLGYQCFVKHPDQHFSEVPAYMTKASFGLSGFTGNHISLDPELNLFNVFLGNRCLNRLTVVTPKTTQALQDLGLNADGSGLIAWPDGTKVYSSVDYVHQKDLRLHIPIKNILSQNGILKG